MDTIFLHVPKQQLAVLLVSGMAFFDVFHGQKLFCLFHLTIEGREKRAKEMG
jgi:hypothetical protein